ncbi:BQ2448_6868 [Microbotryum intermedium]|uniref:BQ2448_6868 protein n=1 Tax=Microbotryum intermedium TaxID=269621 RepID=A0A238FLP2_9BASI|nr:BQ2448_6868 [Microbotryum intermedium]
MTVFTAPFPIPTTSTPYPARPTDPSPHVSSPSSPRCLLRRVNAMLVKVHNHHHRERRTALVPVFSLAELTPSHLLGLLESILATRFDLGGKWDDRADDKWQSVLDDDDEVDEDGDNRVDEQRLQDERILRFLILGLQQALEIPPSQEDDIEGIIAILLLDIDSSHRLRATSSLRSGVKIVQQREQIIAWIVAGLFEIEDRLLDPRGTQVGYDATAGRGENSAHMAELPTSQGTTSATPSTPRKLLFRDSHAQSQPLRTTPLKQALTNYLSPSPSPRLETTPRKSIVDLLRKDEHARPTSPSPKSKTQTLASSSSLLLVKPELERFERSRPRVPIVGVKMAQKEVGAGDSDMDLSERPCDCDSEGYRETDDVEQTEEDCASCAYTDDEAGTQKNDVDPNLVSPTQHQSQGPLGAETPPPTWRLTLPDESNAELFPPARFIPTPLNKYSSATSSSSSTEDEYIVNRRRKKERDEMEKIKLRSCGLDTDLECGPEWIRGWSEKELKGVQGRM